MEKNLFPLVEFVGFVRFRNEFTRRDSSNWRTISCTCSICSQCWSRSRLPSFDDLTRWSRLSTNRLFRPLTKERFSSNVIRPVSLRFNMINLYVREKSSNSVLWPWADWSYVSIWCDFSFSWPVGCWVCIDAHSNCSISSVRLWSYVSNFHRFDIEFINERRRRRIFSSFSLRTRVDSI